MSKENSSQWAFGFRSRRELKGVKAPLQDVANQALSYSPVDFGIIQGVRTSEEQARLVKTWASKTMNSRHLTGHAVDIMAYIGRQGRWDAGLYYRIAEAWWRASKDLGVSITWGGAWGRMLHEYPSAEAAMKAYTREREYPFLDLGHYELPREIYP